MNMGTSQFWDFRKGKMTWLAFLHNLGGFRQRLEHDVDSPAAFYFS
jgi:hypothetical protein